MGSGKQNKPTRGVNPLLVHEGTKGLNVAFPREEHLGETARNGSLFPRWKVIGDMGSGGDIPRKTEGAGCS